MNVAPLSTIDPCGRSGVEGPYDGLAPVGVCVGTTDAPPRCVVTTRITTATRLGHEMPGVSAGLRRSTRSYCRDFAVHLWYCILGVGGNPPSTFYICSRLAVDMDIMDISMDTYIHPFNGPFVRDYPGKPVPER